jgi:hypothetical protein
LILENPRWGQFYGAVDVHSDVGTQSYRGLKLSFQRRAAAGVSLNGNYTLSNCMGDTESGFSFAQFSAGYLDPKNPAFDRGNCTQNRTHIANFTVGAQTPAFSTRALRVIASGWRASGILNARSGGWLSVTTTTDTAATGITGQRLNQVLDNPYGGQDTRHVPEPRRLRTAGGRHAGQPCSQQHRRSSLLGDRFVALAPHCSPEQAIAGAASRDV